MVLSFPLFCFIPAPCTFNSLVNPQPYDDATELIFSDAKCLRRNWMQARYWLVSLDELIVLIGKHLISLFPMDKT